MWIKKFFGHLNTVNRHRFEVFKLSLRAGIPFRGMMHDLSKYSFVEFSEGVKYYNGSRSPLTICKETNGYSKAWLHHKGRNKHHFEYWYDFMAKDKTPIMPFKYFAELICDNIAAGKVYLKHKWTKEAPLTYFNNRKDLEYINEDMKKAIIQVYEMVKENGIEKAITSKNLKEVYNRYCIKNE